MLPKRTLLFVIFLICSLFTKATSLLSDSTIANIRVKSKKIILEIKMDTNFCVGCAIPFSLELTSKKNAEITAGLNFITRKLNKGKFEPFGKSVSLGGPIGFFKDSGEDGIHEWGEYELKQNKIKLKKGEKLSKNFELYSLTNNYLLFPGKYELSVDYEFQLHSQICFIVLLDYETDIPRLISFLEHKRSFSYGEQTPLDVIYALTSYPNWRKLLKEDHYNDFQNVKQWWEENKKAILTVEKTLKNLKYSKFIYKTQLPILIKNLQSKNILEQKQSKQELYDVLGAPSWIDINNFDEQTIQKEIEAINSWWQPNQNVVEYVNFLIINEFK